MSSLLVLIYQRKNLAFNVQLFKKSHGTVKPAESEYKEEAGQVCVGVRGQFLHRAKMIKQLDAKGKYTVGNQVEQNAAEDRYHDSGSDLV